MQPIAEWKDGTQVFTEWNKGDPVFVFRSPSDPPVFVRLFQDEIVKLAWEILGRKGRAAFYRHADRADDQRLGPPQKSRTSFSVGALCAFMGA